MAPRLPPVTRNHLLLAAFVAGLIAVIVVVVVAMTTDVTNSATESGPTNPGGGDAATTAPPFSIPKIPDCTAAPSATLSEITRTMRRGQLRHGFTATDGDLTYVAAQFADDSGEVVRDEPGLWVVRSDRLYAVGATSSLSTATPAAEISVFGDSAAAVRTIGCAAGY